ncbi:hypothetical protein Csa_010410 [Cucumis sativus]|nr:hypothetical protein Csa_010410 [Cucumis sativus]
MRHARFSVGDASRLAAYFPPFEPLKFTIAHCIFGASNIIKLLLYAQIMY